MGRAQDVGAGLARPVAAPLLLASTSPQRRAILAQLGLPFDVAPPAYEEHDPPGLDPVQAVRAHAAGKARSVAALAGRRPVLGVDTAVVLGGRSYGKPADEEEARGMLGALAGRVHEVVSGLCLAGEGWEVVEHDVTRVSFRPLATPEVDAYLETGEWRERAGAYAIQGRGAALVERIEGDYLNVVGLPVRVLVRLLAERFPGRYGFGVAGEPESALPASSTLPARA
jgi:septum formation protein